MAEKSLVNDVAEMLGVDPDDELAVVAELLALAEVLELDLEELPQPAATAETASPNAQTRNKRVLITARSSHRRANRQNELTVSRVSARLGPTVANPPAAVHLD
jgi:hypothetical protein